MIITQKGYFDIQYRNRNREGDDRDVCKGKREGPIMMYYAGLSFIKGTATYIKYFKGEWVTTRFWNGLMWLELEMGKHS